MRENNFIFMTGATGALGRLVALELSRTHNLAVLVLAPSQAIAEARVRAALGPAANSIKILTGDLTRPLLGLSQKEFKELTLRTSGILHAAASTKFTHPLSEARQRNVETTRNIIELALQCPNLSRFGYVSTAFVSGLRSGIILEDEFEHDYGFLNTYEQSKYEAEMLVRSIMEKIPTVVFRPSIVITPPRQEEGPISALHLTLTLAKLGMIPVLPGSLSDTFDVISGTDAARKIAALFDKRFHPGSTYHIASGEHAPKIQHFVELAEQRAGEKLPIRFVGTVETFQKEKQIATRFRPDSQIVYRKLSSFIEELAYPKTFDITNVQQTLGVSFENVNPLSVLELPSDAPII